jgi:hypothetical protein
MMLPPTSLLLLLAEPPPTRPVYDIPPWIVVSPRWPRLRKQVLRMARRHGGRPPEEITACGETPYPIGPGNDLIEGCKHPKRLCN